MRTDGQAPVIVPNRKSRVLLADDTAFFRTTFRDALEEVSCEVVEAADGEQALAALSSGGPFDLVVLDQVMPGLMGTQVVEAMSARGIETRVVLLTGVRSQQIRPQDLAGGIIKATLDKARPIEELIYGVNNILFAGTDNAREWPRVPIKAMAQFRSGGAWQVGRIWDLSHTGLQLRANAAIPKDTVIELKFFLPRGSVPVEGRARVLWQRAFDGGGPNAQAHGLRFEEISAAARKEVVRFVDERAAQLLCLEE